MTIITHAPILMISNLLDLPSKITFEISKKEVRTSASQVEGGGFDFLPEQRAGIHML